LRELLRECPRISINTGPHERVAEGEHSLLLKLGWEYQNDYERASATRR
jgi:hypothetical protein